MGLSNNAQAALVTGSCVLMTIGAYTGYTGGNPIVALSLGLLGCIGLGLKEALGILAPTA